MINHQDQKGTKWELTVHDSSPQNGVLERGMRTQAERAHALLLASGLPCFLWKEAMKHSAWLQDRTPAHALKGKMPYKMGDNKKPHLAGIQEFGAAMYVKDLTAGKLDARAKKGQFVGYDSQSKGYRIYWPEKRSITVEWNIVFNQDDSSISDETLIIHGETLSEGENEKIIQAPQNNAKDVEEPENKDPADQKTHEKAPKAHQIPKESNSIAFPLTNESQVAPEIEPHEDKTL
jgi:hypothetical protein